MGPLSYQISLIVISAFAALALFSIWQNILSRARMPGNRDQGLAYLSSAIAVWVLVGFWNLLEIRFSPYLAEAVLSLLSTTNSLLFLLAIQYFDYAPQWIRRAWWRRACFLSAGLVAGAVIGLGWYCARTSVSLPDTKVLLNVPDVLFSVPTIVALSVGFWRSFYFRGYRFLAWLSLAAMVLVLLVQLPDVLQQLKEQYHDLERMLTISSYALIMMFCFALSTSWGVEVLTLPLPEQTYLDFQGKSQQKWLVDVRVREQRFQAALSPMALKNLLIFVTRVLNTHQPDWVHIERDLNGEYVDFGRVLKPFAKAWQEEADPNLSLNLQEFAEKTRLTFFEYKNPGQYRLKVSTKNLVFSESFFTHAPDLIANFKTNTEKEEVRAMISILHTWVKNQEKSNGTKGETAEIG